MRIRLLAVTFGAATAIAACSTDQPDLTLPSTDTNVVGAFNLYSANGNLLPYDAVVTTTEVWELDSDKIVLAPDQTWVDTTSYTVANLAFNTTAPKVTVAGGTYAIANGLITFTMTSGGSQVFTGSVVSNSLAVNFGGQRYVYTR